MTPREADIAYALEEIDEIEAVCVVAPLGAATGPEKNVEIVVQLHALSARAQARVGSRLAAEFEGGEPPFVLFVDSQGMSTPRFMHRTTTLKLSSLDREEARARSGLRQMRRAANAAARRSTLAATRRAARYRRACIAVAHHRPTDIRRAILGIDADVRSLELSQSDFFRVAWAEIDTGEVDLFVVDAQIAWDHGRRLLAAMELRFGDSPRDHLLIVANGRPSWASQLMTHYPSLSLPAELPKLPSLLEKATRWRRAECDPFLVC